MAKKDEKEAKKASVEKDEVEKKSTAHTAKQETPAKDDAAGQLQNLKVTTIVLAGVVVVMFLWLGWLTARVHQYEESGQGSYWPREMMHQNSDEGYGNRNWQFR